LLLGVGFLLRALVDQFGEDLPVMRGEVLQKGDRRLQHRVRCGHFSQTLIMVSVPKRGQNLRTFAATSRVEPVGLGALEQRLLDYGQVGCRQLRVAAVPAADGLTGDARLAGDLGLGVALGEQLGRLQASRASRAARSSAGLGRRLVGIGGCSHNHPLLFTSTGKAQIGVSPT
jgi:hypothetical protein